MGAKDQPRSQRGARQPRSPWLIPILLGLLPGVAGADRGVPFDYQVHSRVQGGEREGQPRLILVPQSTACDVALSLRREDGRRFQFTAARLPAQEPREFSWTQPLGRQAYDAALTATNLQGETATRRFRFEVLVVPPLEVRVVAEELDVEQRLLVFTASRPVSRVELDLRHAPDGRLDHAVTFAPPAPTGQPLRVPWPPLPGAVQRIGMRVHDTEGFWAEAEFLAWWVEVEHEEVAFDTGRATFDARERVKLERLAQRVQELAATVPAGVPLQLYVAGYTDTVDTTEHNQRLSLARAAAIGRALRAAGSTLPIRCQGFGEEVLAVATADEVDEPRNRRAVVLLGTAPPPRSGLLPRAGWRSLEELP